MTLDLHVVFTMTSQDIDLCVYQFRFGSRRLDGQTVSFWSKPVWTVELFCLALVGLDFSGKGQICGSVHLHSGRLTTYKYPPPIDIREIKAISGLPMPAALEPKRLT